MNNKTESRHQRSLINADKRRWRRPPSRLSICICKHQPMEILNTLCQLRRVVERHRGLDLRRHVRHSARILSINAVRNASPTRGSSRHVENQKSSTVALPAGMYSHSVEVPPNARWLLTAGQVGVRLDGSIAEGFEAQHDQIWQNTLAILADAGMGPENIVRLNVYSTDPDGLKYLKVHRERYLTPGHTPASTWVVVSKLANPKWVVEMETVAAKA